MRRGRLPEAADHRRRAGREGCVIRSHAASRSNTRSTRSQWKSRSSCPRRAFSTVEIQVMTETSFRADAVDARLGRINLPRMKIEDRRPAVDAVDAFDCPPRHGVGRQPEVATPSSRQIATQEASGRDRNLEQPFTWAIREARRLRHAIVVMLNRIDTRAISIAGLGDSVEGPEIVAADREAGRPIAHHRDASNVLKDFARPNDVVFSSLGDCSLARRCA